MAGPLGYAPIAAARFAVPEFLPQIRKLAATRDSAGISWSWATLTGANNAAWIAYFTLAGTLAVMLTRRGACCSRNRRREHGCPAT